MMQNQRIDWIDWAKVICIYLMVVCHAGQKGLLLDITYQFHMPAFLIISGMLFRPRGIKNEIKLFGIPIFLLGGVNLLHKLLHAFVKSDLNLFSFIDKSQFIIGESVKSLLFDSTISWFQGYWFVITLFLMRILMNNRYVFRRKEIIAVCCVIWCCVESFIEIPTWIISFKPYHIISCLPFFIIGTLIKEKGLCVLKGNWYIKFGITTIFFNFDVCSRSNRFRGISIWHKLFSSICKCDIG